MSIDPTAAQTEPTEIGTLQRMVTSANDVARYSGTLRTSTPGRSEPERRSSVPLDLHLEVR